MVKIFYDLETTGVKATRHGIHQLAGMVEVDGQVVETFNIKMRPNPKAEVLPEALAIAGVTEADLAEYMPMADAFALFVGMVCKYVNRFDKKDKAHLVGYNNRAFDDIFLRAWFEQNGDSFFGAYFWTDTLDTLVLASQYLLAQRPQMPTFKLKRVALTLGLTVDKSKLHDALYDVTLTREIYRIVTGEDLNDLL